MTVQTRGTLDKEIRSVEEDLIRITDLVKSAIQRAIQALADRDSRAAQDIITSDSHINDLRFKVEQMCLTTIATQQPMARDLRELMAAMVVVTELERMGDHAAGIAKIAQWMEEQPQGHFPRRLQTMVDHSVDMLEQVMDALVARDAEAARVVAAHDDEIDRLHRDLFAELVENTLANERDSNAALNLLFASHNIERIGDRITNIAERVIFVVEGKLEELNVNH